MIKVIINADDYGLTRSCTDAIVRSFENNFITDTTMVANGTAFEYAVQLVKEKKLDGLVGIHFNLTEGQPLTKNILRFPEFVKDGVFHGKINRLKRLSKKAKQAVYEELSAQVERISGAGINITHADSHHHIHTALYIAPIFKRVCLEHGIDKARLHRNVGKISFIKMVIKKRYNKWLKKSGFITTDYFTGLRELDEITLQDVTELMAHPDFDKDGCVVDRVDVLDGFAIGKEMYDLTLVKEIELLRYRGL